MMKIVYLNGQQIEVEESNPMVGVPRGKPDDYLRREINAERDRRLALGVTVTVSGYGDIPLQGRPFDQTNLLALKDTARDLIAAKVNDAIIPFRDANNRMHMLTAAQVIEMTAKGKAAASEIYRASWAIKDGAAPPDDYTDDKWWPSFSRPPNRSLSQILKITPVYR